MQGSDNISFGVLEQGTLIIWVQVLITSIILSL